MEATPIVVVVDDDDSLRRALKRLLTTAGYVVETYATARELLQREPLDAPGCLVLDVHLPEIGGMRLRELLRRLGYTIPVVFITGHGDVQTGVRAMKAGAVDFLAKPFNDGELFEAVRRALLRDAEARRERAELADLQRRYRTLTQREREVCTLVASGKLNKQIAAALGTSEKTIKVHRARVMHKMRVGSVAELVRAVDRLARGLDEAGHAPRHTIEDVALPPAPGPGLAPDGPPKH